MLESDWMEHCALDVSANTQKDSDDFREHGVCFPLWAVTVELGHRFVADYGQSRAAMVASADRHIAKGWRGVAITRLDTLADVEGADRDIDRLEDWATDHH